MAYKCNTYTKNLQPTGFFTVIVTLVKQSLVQAYQLWSFNMHCDWTVDKRVHRTIPSVSALDLRVSDHIAPSSCCCGCRGKDQCNTLKTVVLSYIGTTRKLNSITTGPTLGSAQSSYKKPVLVLNLRDHVNVKLQQMYACQTGMTAKKKSEMGSIILLIQCAHVLGSTVNKSLGFAPPVLSVSVTGARRREMCVNLPQSLFLPVTRHDVIPAMPM